MSKKTALIILLIVPLFTVKTFFAPDYSFAEQKQSSNQVTGSNTIKKESLNNTFYNFYWFSLSSILALPFVLRLLRTGKEESFDDEDIQDDEGIKGGLSTDDTDEDKEEEL